MWTEQDAQQKFAGLLRRAEGGEPQFLGELGVVISREAYARLEALEEDEKHPGKWLAKHFAGLGDIEPRPRDEDRPSPFEGWADADFGK